MASQNIVDKPKLNVIFDSNIAFNNNNRYLVGHAVHKLITNNSARAEIDIKWILPEVVKLERTYQIRQACAVLLPSIKELAKRLEQDYGVNNDSVYARIDELINRQIRDLNLHVISPDYYRMGWNSIVLSSAFRVAPFSEGETEKGFRDAIILETVAQIVTDSSKDLNLVGTVFLTNDNLLISAMQKRIGDQVIVCRSPEQCEEHINIVVAGLIDAATETFIRLARKRAAKFYSDSRTKTGLYYDVEVYKQIKERYANELDVVPPSSTHRENYKRVIYKPIFDRNENERFYWKSRLGVRFRGSRPNEFDNLTYGRNAQSMPFPFMPPNYFPRGYFPNLPTETSRTYMGAADPYDPNINPRLSFEFTTDTEGRLETERVRVTGEGETLFEVEWSVVIDNNYSFSDPKLGNISYVETLWNPI